MKTTKVYVVGADWDETMNDYCSYRIPKPSFVTVLINNKDSFKELFDEEEYEMVLQGLRDEVLERYNSGETFPRMATPSYKVGGFVSFRFNRIERDEYGEKLFVYYDFESTAS